jgi:ribosomal protein S18 acetylase RimI-like enzyme
VRIRRLESGDSGELRAFLNRIPAADRNFFKEDVLDAATVDSWLRDGRGRRALALDDEGQVVGYAAVLSASGWSRHVGEIRLVVDPAARRRGVGQSLARWAVLEGARLGLSKVFVEVVADQEPAIVMFQQFGFVGGGLLKDHILDRHGKPRDLVILSMNLADSYSAMASLGMDQL